MDRKGANVAQSGGAVYLRHDWQTALAKNSETNLWTVMP